MVRINFDRTTWASRPGWTDAKTLILQLIQANGGEFEGKTRLFKAFYFAHLFYVKAAGEALTLYPVVKMPQGPGIDAGDMLLADLEADGLIESRTLDYGPYPVTVFVRCGEKAPEPDSVRKQAIKDTLMFIADKTAAQLSAITHEMSRSWQNARMGEELAIVLDSLSDQEYSEQTRVLGEARSALSGLFS